MVRKNMISCIFVAKSCGLRSQENTTRDTDDVTYDTRVTFECVEGHFYFHDEDDDYDDTTQESMWCSHEGEWWACQGDDCREEYSMPNCQRKPS